MGGKISKGSGRKGIVLGDQLSVVQELGKNGIDCILMNHHRAISSYSKYGTYVRCPNPSTEEDEAIDFLSTRCSEEGNFPVLLPATDQWSMALSKHLDTLKGISAPCIGNPEAVGLMLHKDQFCRWGQEKGFMTPRSWTLEQVRQLSKEDYPILAKPKLHRWSSNSDPEELHLEMVRLRFTLIKNKWELEEFLEREKPFQDYLFFQEYVRGRSDRIYNIGLYVDRSSKILASLAGHKIRGCLTNHGDCNLGENIVPPPELLENAKRIIEELNYSGIVEFEYKQDSETGEFKLIEVNPHFWLWCGIGPACGVNFPMIAYQDMTETYDPATLTPFKAKVKFVRVIPDLMNCLIYCKTNCQSPPFSFSDWRNDLRADKTVFYEFNNGDWLVTTLQIGGAFGKLIMKASMHFERKINNFIQGPGAVRSNDCRHPMNGKY